jgi:hypothetical protein
MIDDVRGTYGSALGLSTSGGSGTGAVSYAVVTAGTAGCSVAVNGTDLLATNAGTCIVRATKAASVNHNVRASTDATITFDKIVQPSSLAMADTSVTFGTTLTLSATGGNGGGALSYDVSAPGTAGCSISGATTLSVSAGGSCTVLVTRASSTNYLSRNDSVSITASRANQATLSIADVNGTYGEAFLLSTTGGSGTGAVSYAVTSTGSAGCAYTSGAITVSSVGTCAITATKASDNSYNLKTTSTTTLTFSKGAQASLSLADDGMMFGATLQLIATGGSGDGALSYSLATTGTASCALTGTSVTATTVGTCTVNIAKAASTNFLMKSQIFTITVGVAPQLAISITTASGTVNTSIPLVFTGGSGNGATTWSVTDAGTARCGVIGNALLASGVGTCSVRITKAAEDNYLVASASRSISITAVVVAPSQGQIATPSVTNAPTTTTSTSTTTTIALAASPTPDSSPRTPAVATTIPEKTSTTTSTVPVQVALLKKLEKVQASSALMMQGDSAFAASVTRVNNSLVMDAGIFKAVIKGMDKEGNVIPLDAKGDLRIPRGGSISVNMGRYLPNSEVFIWMFSTPKSLGERNTDARGNILTRIATPRKIEPGLHRVAFVGKNPAGRDITFMIGLIVADPSTLSTANKILISIPITMAIFAGFLLPTRVRRRKKLSIAL